MTISTNLIPTNARQISASVQSLVGQISSTGSVEIQQYSVLNQVIPDSLFVTGSFEQIQQNAFRLAETYVNQIPKSTPRFSIPSLLPSFPPKRPSYGQIKNFIETKIDRIKRQRQQASLKALEDELRQREDPFAFRQTQQNRQEINTVLGRFNNQ